SCGERSASDRLARGREPSAAAVRNGSAGNLRRNGADSPRGARSRRAHQSGGNEPRQRCGPGRCLRRYERHAGAIDHPRVARRKDRYHSLQRRDGGVCAESAQPRKSDARANRRSRSQEAGGDRKSTRLNSSHVSISYAVFCLKKKKKRKTRTSSLNISLSTSQCPQN